MENDSMSTVHVHTEDHNLWLNNDAFLANIYHRVRMVTDEAVTIVLVGSMADQIKVKTRWDTLALKLMFTHGTPLIVTITPDEVVPEPEDKLEVNEVPEELVIPPEQEQDTNKKRKK